MTVLSTLLIGPSGYGGEGVYARALEQYPPRGVAYDTSLGFHTSAGGATCLLAAEVILNQTVRPMTIPDIGFRALRLRNRYDLIHSHAHPVLLRGLAKTPLVMSEGSSAAVYLTDYLGWEPERLRSRFARSSRIYRMLGIHDRLLAMGRAACVYVFSEWAREINVRWGADPTKLEVIYPGFCTPAPVDRSVHRGFTFLFVGTDFERKGGYDVVEAFARIAGDLPDTHLVLAGFDPLTPNPDLRTHSWVSPQRRERVHDQLIALQHDLRVTVCRKVTQAQLKSELFPTADAFVMPTLAEGFGFTNVEAMSFGLPVVTTTVGPSAEIVTHGQTGILIHPGDVAALADAMQSLATSRSHTAELGDAARARFKERFSREKFQHALGALYARAVGQ